MGVDLLQVQGYRSRGRVGRSAAVKYSGDWREFVAGSILVLVEVMALVALVVVAPVLLHQLA